MQSRRMSLIEGLSNSVLAFCISTAIQMFMFTLKGVTLHVWESAAMVAVFTLVSIVRNYVWRRGFVWLDKHGYDRWKG